MAETKTWFGGTGNFNTPRHWSPAGVPQAGDTAVISSGTVRIADSSLLDVPVHLGSTDPNNAPVFIARNEALGNVMVGSEPPPPDEMGAPREFATMVVGGVVSIHSLQVAGFLTPTHSSSPAELGITLNGGAVLDNPSGWVQQPNGTIDISGPNHSAFINDGTVTSIGGSMDVGVPLAGEGTFELEFGNVSEASLTLENKVGPGETFNLRSGPAVLTLTDPMQFLGEINDGPEGFVVLPDRTTTSSSYQNGVLSLFNNDELVAALRITSVTGADFQISNIGGNINITVGQSPSMAMAAPDVPAAVILPTMTS
jgi:hypothetical protein